MFHLIQPKKKKSSPTWKRLTPPNRSLAEYRAELGFPDSQK